MRVKIEYTLGYFFNKTYSDNTCTLIKGPALDVSGNFIGVMAAEVDDNGMIEHLEASS